MTLYAIANEYQEMLDLLEQLPPEDPEHYEEYEEAIRNTLSSLLLDLEEKAEDYGKVLKQLQADAEMVKREKLRLAERQSTIERNIERMREGLKNAMMVTGNQKIKTNLFSFSVSSRWKAVLDVDPEEVPLEYWKRQEIKLDMAAIEKWLKADQCKNAQECDWAHLDEVFGLTVR